MHVIRHQHVGVYLELIIVSRRIEAVVKVLVVLFLEENLLSVTTLLNDVLWLIYY